MASRIGFSAQCPSSSSRGMSPNEAEDWWQRARLEVEGQRRANCGRRRIFQLVSGDKIAFEVEQPADMGDGGPRQTVGAIFHTPTSYVVFSMYRSMREVPSESVEAVDFDA